MLMPRDLLRALEDRDRTREVLRKLLNEPERRNRVPFAARAAYYPSTSVNDGITLHTDSDTPANTTGDLYMTDVERAIAMAAEG